MQSISIYTDYVIVGDAVDVVGKMIKYLKNK